MGLMDKVKKILFDEDEVEIPINSEELPEREPKKIKAVERDNKGQGGFIDYHQDEEREEDTIKEIIVPKTELEENKEKPAPKKEFKFPIEDSSFDASPIRSRSHEEIKEEPKKSPMRSEKRNFFFDDEPVKKEEEKGYNQILQTPKETPTGKKPFRVTPVISPVYGILDKNYKPEVTINKTEVPSETIERKLPRRFGPVSYNDQPIPNSHKYELPAEKSLKEELVELNTTISELIDDSVKPSEVIDEMPAKAKKNNEKIENEDLNIETSGIEDEYIGNTNIEDAFESTNEFTKIKEEDEENLEVEDLTPELEQEDLINKEEEESLDETIETDLFNLIDSMYKSNEVEEEEQ